jgi:hypothetical protein
MIRILKKLQAILQAPRVVAWGGSGGGFAAIRIARDVPNAIALVWNPQTNIAKYSRVFVDRYRRIAFPAIAAAGPIPSDGEQFPSLCTEAFREGYQGRIVYLQESTDWHVDAHLKPFLESFCAKPLTNIINSAKFSGFVTDQLYLHLGHWGKGHVPPSKAVLAKLWPLPRQISANNSTIWPASGELRKYRNGKRYSFSWFDGGCEKILPLRPDHNHQLLGVYEGNDTHPSKETVTTNRANYSLIVILKHEPTICLWQL